ncbi:MAG: hypothetical protein BWY63_02480 [Chloroflexi bacterium ADurb.Bin360]|nr:MAG: hypothetical protein BWY63_02480 [Chloroflexi bacterium ADurb.Bin360]
MKAQGAMLRWGSLLAVLALVLTVAQGGMAQGPGGDQNQPQVGAIMESADTVLADLGAGFMFQGVLTENGTPVTGSRQMEFKLWDAASGGVQVGATTTLAVAVVKGQFSVALMDWGPEQINGRALWLGVRAKDAGGVWRDLGLRPILATPYAMSLMPGAHIVSASTGDVLRIETSGYGYPLRVVTSATGYDAIWGTGPNQGVYGDTTGTSQTDSGVYGGAFATTGSAKGGYFFSRKGIGVYGNSETVEGVYGESDNHDGVTGRSVIAGRSGVFGFSVNGNGVSAGSTKAHGVNAWSSATTGAAHGVYGTTTSPGGAGVYGINSSTGAGVAGFRSGYSPADQTIFWLPAGQFGGDNGVVGFSKTEGGRGVVGWNKATAGAWSIGIQGVTESPDGWAGYFFTSNGNGVSITTPVGKSGLVVAGGSKSAAVATDDGARLLYSEEATEVWFADYGFGKLENGKAVITIDPLFAQTVALEEPYHVFVQAYGDAELYVSARTATSFEVHAREGDGAVEFSYRIVAKRLGFEDARLERAPFADGDPNLFPERASQDPQLQPEVPAEPVFPAAP